MKSTRVLVASLALGLVAQKVRAEPKTILFLGDSLTAGYGLNEEQAYPALIQKKIKKDGLDWTVVNAGVSGDTTKGGLSRVPWLLKTKPAFVLVALGANDGLRGVPVKETQKNLDAILTQFKISGASAALTGMILPVNYGPDYRAEFKNVFPALAKKHKVPFYPFLLKGVAQNKDLNLSDGMHPNARGQEIMAENIYRFLKPFLAEAKKP